MPSAPPAPASRRPFAFLGLLAIAQLVVARRGLVAAPLADIDSVCHVAYVEYFVQRFWPEAHALVGYTPDYNLGAPFLLFNVPPGVTWLGALLVLAGFSAANAIKALLYVGWLAVPALGFFLAEALAEENEPRVLSPGARTLVPYAAALALALFSGDLFGLEFFLHGGMVNACLGLPLMLGGLLAFVRAARSPGRLHVVPLLTGAAVFAATVLTHVLSAYFLAIGVGCLVFGARARGLGTRALAAAVIVIVGAALTAWWALPSALFAPDHESSYNWIRGPRDTVFAFFDGSAMSSVFDAFAERYRRLSNVGLVAVVPGVVGVVESVRLRATGFRAIALFWLVCLGVAMGPHPSFGLAWLPGYERLLWYRFLTPAIAAWLLVAAFGVARLVTIAQARGAMASRFAVGASGLGAALVFATLLEAGSKIETTDAYAEFEEDYAAVTAWLREHGDTNARVFGEFLAFPEDPVPSVNTLRQRLPVDSGVPEVAGWVYENSLASARLVERGLLWWGAPLYTDEREHLNLGYVVANSATTIRAFEHDTRWEAVVRRPNLVLFASRDRAPGLFGADERRVSVEHAHRLGLGGYRYALEVDGGAARELLARISWSPAWHATVNGANVAPRVRDDGFFTVALPEGPARVELTWTVEAPLRRGLLVTDSAVLLLATVALALARTRGPHRTELPIFPWLERLSGAAAALVTVALVIAGQRHRVGEVHFGPAQGVVATRTGRELALGTAQELEDGALIEAVPGAFASATRVGLTPARAIDPAAHHHLVVHVSRGGKLRLETAPAGRFTVEAVDTIASSFPCRFEVTSGEPFALPSPCATADRSPGPGEVFALRLAGTSALARVKVEDAITVVQAESFFNVHDDGQHDALPWPGLRGDPMNGMLQAASASFGEPVRTAWRSHAPEGRYRAYLLTNRVPVPAARYRADFVLTANGLHVGRADVADERLRDDTSEWNVHPGWLAMGAVDLRPGDLLAITWERRPGSLGGFGAWDALALERVDDAAKP